MLRKLKINYFRSVIDEELEFLPGMVVIRGRNEQGKSTRLEALAYALGGAKALREPLSDVVTWGRPEKDLRVEATLFVQGRTLRFIRHKGGAEVYVGDETKPYMTGQGDVTKFAAEVLGCDMKMAANLMLASQGAIRGALDSDRGDEAVRMIETLADFGLFDTLMEQIDAELVTGRDTAHRERVERAQAALDSPLVAKPDHSAALIQLADHEHKLAEALAATTAAQKRLTDAQVAVRVQKAQESAYASLVNQVTSLRNRVESETREVANLEKEASREFDQGLVQQLREQIADSDSVGRALDAHAALASLATVLDGDEWEGDEESLRQAVASARAEVEGLNAEIGETGRKITALRAQIIQSTDCPTCGQKLCNHEVIAENNAKFEAEARRLEAHRTEFLAPRKTEAESDLRELLAVEDRGRKVSRFLQAHGSFVNADFGFVPARVSWKGAVPVRKDDAQLRRDLNSLLSLERSIEKAKVSLGMHVKELEGTKRSLAEKEAELAASPRPSGVEDLRKEEAAADEALVNLRANVRWLESNVSDIRASIASLDAQYEASQNERARLEADYLVAKQELETLQRNNTLKAKVRSARPQVADQLWGMVLSAVSTMFSKMRGEKSIVTKDSTGFLVNGHPIKGLSGSTLDALGLAIRFALIRTFVPNCPFMVLDEPFAACDEDRAATVLGYIRAAGFPQVLLVTHESRTEQLADQYLEI